MDEIVKEQPIVVLFVCGLDLERNLKKSKETELFSIVNIQSKVISLLVL